MKKFIKENKLFIKSIIITLLLQAINYFLIGNLVSDYKILGKINFNEKEKKKLISLLVVGALCVISLVALNIIQGKELNVIKICQA